MAACHGADSPGRIPILTICADCECHALRRPKQGKAVAEALLCLTRLLLRNKRLQDLQIVRESCLPNCPFGRIRVALKRGDQEVRQSPLA